MSSQDPQDFSGKVVVITGASSPYGIGAEAARQFAKNGAHAVVITSREQSEKSAKEVTVELEKIGSKALWVPGDIADPSTPATLIAKVQETFGRIDVLVNNAGIKIDKPVNAISVEEWDSVMNTNLRAAYLTIKESIRLFSKETGGAIVNTASIVGKYGNTGQANYAAAKAGLEGLTRSVAIDLGRRGVRVNCVLPGFVETDMTHELSPDMKEMLVAATPLGRIGTARDIANMIVFLSSSKAAFVTGQSVVVDGGLDGGVIAISGIVRAGYKKN